MLRFVGCPDENVLVQLVDGSLPTDVRADHARHLDECSSCREAVGSLVRMLTPEDHPAFARTVASEHPPAPGVHPASGTRDGSPGGHGYVAGDVVGRYQLERVLGEGGLGVVWAARHVLTRKPVALKFTKFADPELVKRFLREARVGGLLRHPAAVEVHDVFETQPGGPLVMVMDLLSGESLDQLLATSDVISLHVPLSPQSRHLIDRTALSRMKRSAYLINTSRGPVVDEDALAWALREGIIKGAGLDVYEEEPKIHPGLLALDNVVLVPHMASATAETRAAMYDLVARNVVNVLNGQDPVTPIP